MRQKTIITDKQRAQIEALAGYGMSDDDIASVVGIAKRTMQRHCIEYLKLGRAKAKTKISQTAYKMAESGKNPAMTMFWLKTQCRWKEVHEVEQTQQQAEQPKIVIVRIPDNGREKTKE